MQYNASRQFLVMREYGRHVQLMVDHILTVEDPVSRQRQAEGVVELMAFLNPQLKAIEDYQHKLWDHLFVISEFKLDVESPYGKPEKATYKAKPAPLRYPKRKPRYNHLGKNLEMVINKAMAEENADKKSGFAHVIAHYMKLAYSNWHNELVHDDGIRQELNSLTNGQLEFSATPFVRHKAAREEELYPYAKRNNNQNNNRNFRNNNNNRNNNRQGTAGPQQFRNGNGNGNGNSNGNSQQTGGQRPNNNQNNKFNKKRFGKGPQQSPQPGQ